MVGTVAQGQDVPEQVSLSVNDGAIHSGTFRTSPCDGISSDSYVLQGGSPSGCDNGNSFTLGQANGHFEFFEARNVTFKCPQPQGFWKNNPAAWPVSSLTLGAQSYTKNRLLVILATAAGGDASLILADQLIAAMVNETNGSDPTPISSTLSDANTLLSMFSGGLPYSVRSSSTIGQKMVNDASTLDSYNNGALTPTCTP